MMRCSFDSLFKNLKNGESRMSQDDGKMINYVKNRKGTWSLGGSGGSEGSGGSGGFGGPGGSRAGDSGDKYSCCRCGGSDHICMEHPPMSSTSHVFQQMGIAASMKYPIR